MPSVLENWVDVAKGAAILLVLPHHAWETLSPDTDGAQLWGTLDQALASMRMPTFFMISGLFAARAVTGPFGRTWRDKVLSFGYVHLLWSGH